MSDLDLSERLHEAVGRVPVGPAPMTAMVHTARRRRRSRWIGVGLVAGAMVVSGWQLAPGAVTGARVLGASNPSTRSIHTSAIPPGPAPFTLLQAKHEFLGQEFRPYSGAQPPGVSERQALKRAKAKGAYSLGLIDVGLVSGEGQSRRVTWRSVWTIGFPSYVPDMNVMGMGGRGKFGLQLRPAATPSASPMARPGWLRVLNLVDAQSGSTFLSSVS